MKRVNCDLKTWKGLEPGKRMEDPITGRVSKVNEHHLSALEKMAYSLYALVIVLKLGLDTGRVGDGVECQAQVDSTVSA